KYDGNVDPAASFCAAVGAEGLLHLFAVRADKRLEPDKSVIDELRRVRCRPSNRLAGSGDPSDRVILKLLRPTRHHILDGRQVPDRRQARRLTRNLPTRRLIISMAP